MASTVYDFERDAARRWGPVEGVELLRKAESFARAAWLAIEEGDREIATDVAALAAVTAADAVACIRLGKRSAAPARREAVRLLLQADPTATEAARVVDQLLQLRQQGRRGVPVTESEARRSVIRAARVVEYASSLALGEN